MNLNISKKQMEVIDRISTFIADLCISSNAARPFCDYRKHVFIIEFPKKGNSKLIEEIEKLGNEVFIDKNEETKSFECSTVFIHNKGFDIKPIGG